MGEEVTRELPWRKTDDCVKPGSGATDTFARSYRWTVNFHQDSSMSKEKSMRKVVIPNAVYFSQKLTIDVLQKKLSISLLDGIDCGKMWHEIDAASRTGRFTCTVDLYNKRGKVLYWISFVDSKIVKTECVLDNANSSVVTHELELSYSHMQVFNGNGEIKSEEINA